LKKSIPIFLMPSVKWCMVFLPRRLLMALPLLSANFKILSAPVKILATKSALLFALGE
jgi:hypothetical protein